MATFFTSDLHFYHRAIREYTARPWATLDEMNEGLVARWNETVGRDDRVYVLGDVSFAGTEKTKAMTTRLNGTKILIRGNHDSGSAERWRNQGFAEVYTQFSMEIGGQLVKMSHYPYHGDHTDGERFLDRRPIDQGNWLLHGHVHREWQVNGRQINVGVDVWDWRPVHESKILEIMEASHVRG